MNAPKSSKYNSASSSTRNYTGLDNLIDCFDNALVTLFAKPKGNRASPVQELEQSELTDAERKLSAGLMRVNHTGEICAQALYQGQALTAKLPEVREEMQHAANEEIDHLDWCAERLQNLDSHTSYLNPLFYAGSFAIGAIAGAISDRISLGFVAATEDQVCTHLDSHMEKLPENDFHSRAIVAQMREDEAKHQAAALEAGGIDFPAPVKKAMTQISALMTKTTFRI